MDLIKKIRQAETQAQQIVEQAKAAAASQAQKNRARRLEALAEAEQERKKATEVAVAAAKSQSLAEIRELKAGAQQKRRQLRDKVASKMATAVARVMDYLGSHPDRASQNGGGLRG